LLSLKCGANAAMNWALFIEIPLLRVNVKQTLNVFINLRAYMG
jgi:hypothetical protein